MAAFSALMGSGNAPLGLNKMRKVSSSSTVDRDMLPPPPPSSSSSLATVKMPRIKIEAAPSNLGLGLGREDQLMAAVEVFDYKKMQEEEEEEEKRVSVTDEDMDLWIQQSIGEIVSNIGEAPLLVQIFSQGPSVLKLQKERASPNTWPLVKKSWTTKSSVPDGLILVEEIKDEEDNNSENNGKNQTWGLIVQGRGMDCAASCYVLNTCRVRSVGGFCTHFCLVRAKCFGESLDKQLRKAWLQGRW